MAIVEISKNIAELIALLIGTYIIIMFITGTYIALKDRYYKFYEKKLIITGLTIMILTILFAITLYYLSLQL